MGMSASALVDTALDSLGVAPPSLPRGTRRRSRMAPAIVGARPYGETPESSSAGSPLTAVWITKSSSEYCRGWLLCRCGGWSPASVVVVAPNGAKCGMLPTNAGGGGGADS